MSELIKHWAEDLQTGDRCLATIRREGGYENNIHNANIIVIENNLRLKKITGFYKEEKFIIPYNELRKIT